MLPVTFVFGRPSRAELLTFGGCAVLVASALAWARTTAQQPPPAPDVPPPQTVLLQISSVPSGANVLLDGQPLGTTPVSGAVQPGPHAIVLRAQDAIDEARTIERAVLAALVCLTVLTGTAQAQSATTVFAKPGAAALDPVPNATPTPASASSSSTPPRRWCPEWPPGTVPRCAAA